MPRASTGLWKQRSGETIHVSEMDDGHLANAYAMMLRNLERAQREELESPEEWEAIGKKVDWIREWVDKLGDEIARRRKAA